MEILLKSQNFWNLVNLKCEFLNFQGNQFCKRKGDKMNSSLIFTMQRQSKFLLISKFICSLKFKEFIFKNLVDLLGSIGQLSRFFAESSRRKIVIARYSKRSQIRFIKVRFVELNFVVYIFGIFLEMRQIYNKSFSCALLSGSASNVPGPIYYTFLEVNLQQFYCRIETFHFQNNFFKYYILKLFQSIIFDIYKKILFII